jgi:hypothetical protein
VTITTNSNLTNKNYDNFFQKNPATIVSKKTTYYVCIRIEQILRKRLESDTLKLILKRRTTFLTVSAPLRQFSKAIKGYRFYKPY